MSTSRLLAILFADLVDSTATVARLGPDAGENWRKRFLAAMREPLAASRGDTAHARGEAEASRDAARSFGMARLGDQADALARRVTAR